MHEWVKVYLARKSEQLIVSTDINHGESAADAAATAAATAAAADQH